MLETAWDATKSGPQAEWIYDHWEPVKAAKDGDGVRFRCVNYDVATRTCLAYESRPRVCSEFPFYGKDPKTMSVSNVCGYQAELGRTVLPLTVL